MIMKTVSYYEVQHTNGGTIGKNGEYDFPTAKEATDMAIEFKQNPRSHNDMMSDRDVEYWQSQTFVVVKKTTTTEEIVKI